MVMHKQIELAVSALVVLAYVGWLVVGWWRGRKQRQRVALPVVLLSPSAHSPPPAIIIRQMGSHEEPHEELRVIITEPPRREDMH